MANSNAFINMIMRPAISFCRHLGINCLNLIMTDQRNVRNKIHGYINKAAFSRILFNYMIYIDVQYQGINS